VAETLTEEHAKGEKVAKEELSAFRVQLSARLYKDQFLLSADG
jgi:hypothetical protein